MPQLGEYFYEPLQVMLSSQSIVGSRISDVQDVDQSVLDDEDLYCFAYVPLASLPNEELTLQIAKQTKNPTTGVWHDTGSVFWQGGPGAVWTGIGVGIDDLNRQVRYVAITPSPSVNVTLWLGHVTYTIEQAQARASKDEMPHSVISYGGKTAREFVRGKLRKSDRPICPRHQECRVIGGIYVPGRVRD